MFSILSPSEFWKRLGNFGIVLIEDMFIWKKQPLTFAQECMYVIYPEPMEILGKCRKNWKFWNILDSFGKFRIIIFKVRGKLWRREGYIKPLSPLCLWQCVYLKINYSRCIERYHIFKTDHFCNSDLIFCPIFAFLNQMDHVHEGGQTRGDGKFVSCFRFKIRGRKTVKRR